MKKLLIIASSVLFVATITMTVLFIRANNSKNTFIGFSSSCMESYSTAVDYIMCREDVLIGNTNFYQCNKYLEGIVEDTKYVRELGYEADYNYIGE